MDFDLGPEAEAFRLEVRAFLEHHFDEQRRRDAWRLGTLHDWQLHREMAARGWIAPHWPRSEGGDGRGELERVAMYEEFDRVGAPLDGLLTTMLAIETIKLLGNAEQREAYVPPALAGTALTCLGYSEPDSGSDVAAAKTRATRVDDSVWSITGQKMFTSLAHEAAHMFALTRTNDEVPKHRGLTVFMIPMQSPGIDVRPIQTLGGQLVNVVHLTDVTVPDTARIGEVDGGWRVMTTGLALERTVTQGPGKLFRHVEHWAQASGAIWSAPLREQLARIAIDAEVSKLFGYRLAWMAMNDKIGHVEGSMAKLFGSERFNRAASVLLDALGPHALLTADSAASAAGGEIEQAYRYAPFTTIAGGVSEVQRSIIAEHGLGLPKSR
jgi:alkylation response protein AidB-like acyl-CoA dehydrogenase